MNSSRTTVTSGVWEVTTEHGTRLVLDVDERQWMRLPDPDSSAHRYDGQWQRLFIVVPASGDAFDDGGEVVVGQRLRVFSTMSEWHRTSVVVAVRPLDDNEVPDPSPIRLRRAPADDGTWEVYGGDLDVRGTGESPAEAAGEFAAALDAWLDDQARNPSLLDRWYATHVDRVASIRGWVLDQLES